MPPMPECSITSTRPVDNTSELLRVSTELQSVYFKRAEAVKKAREANERVTLLEASIKDLEDQRTKLVQVELGQ